MDFFVDSHCHLDVLVREHGRDIGEIITKAEEAGVAVYNNVCTRISDYEYIRNMAGFSKKIFMSVGIHPEHSAEESVTVGELVKMASDRKVIGIGEVGLEYYHKPIDESVQKKNFEVHIEACRQTELPLIIHSRDADSDMIDILKSEMKNGDFSFLLHCFSSGRELAYTALDLGGYISLSGIVTFKNAKDLQDIVKDLPPASLMLETDSPYLSPVPFRGHINEPAHLKSTGEFLAQFLDIPVDEIKNITTGNFFKLFKKAKI